jgi:hypothetical protein
LKIKAYYCQNFYPVFIYKKTKWTQARVVVIIMLALPHHLNGKAKGYVWYNPFITCIAYLSAKPKVAEQQCYALSNVKLTSSSSLSFKRSAVNFHGRVLGPG